MDGGDEDVDENSSVNWMVKKHKANTLETKYLRQWKETMETTHGHIKPALPYLHKYKG